METTKKTNAQVDEQAAKAAAIKNQKMMKMAMYVGGGILGVVILVFLYITFYVKPNNEAAEAEISKVDEEMIMLQQQQQPSDSVLINVAKKYEVIANKYSNDLGDRAAAAAVGLYYKVGQYDKAIAMADKYSSMGSEAIDAGVECTKGDCYVNKNKLDEALASYESALSKANNNPELVPYIWAKQARVYHAKKDYAKEVELLEKIDKEYPKKSNKIDLERAKLLKK